MQSQQTLHKAFGGSDDVYSFRLGAEVDRVLIHHYEDGEYRSDFLLDLESAEVLWETLKMSGYHGSVDQLVVVSNAPATVVRAPSLWLQVSASALLVAGIVAIVAAFLG